MLKTEWLGAWGIWGAGRDGKQFFQALSKGSRSRVSAFYDLDPKKIGTTIDGVPVLHRDEMRMRETPVVVCVALDRSQWETSVEDALQSMRDACKDDGMLIEGKHYYHMV